MTAKEILEKVKAVFNAPPMAPAPAPAPILPGAAAAPPAPAPIATGTPFKLKDGTDISITLADPSNPAPAVGDMVTVAGAPAPAADYILEDGTILTVGATGAIEIIVAPEPATQPDFTAPPALTLEDRIKAIEVRINAPITMAAIEGTGGLTTEALKAMYDKFATGSSEERISNLEIMIKALMECNFGYQIRQGQESEAINVYKNAIAPVQAGMQKQDEVIKGLFEIVEKLVELPGADPATLTGAKKDAFDRAKKKEAALAEVANAFEKMKNTKRY